MALLVNELYLVKIPENWSDKKGFIQYLKGILRETLFRRLDTVLQDIDPSSTKILLREDSLPSVPTKKQFPIQIMQSAQLEEEKSEIDPISEDSAAAKLEQADSLKEDLEQLNPLEESEPVEETFEVSELLKRFCDQVHYFKILKAGMDCGNYFGISREELLKGTVFNLEKAIRTVDFGTPESKAFNLFYPAFSSLKEHLEEYYNLYLKRRDSDGTDSNDDNKLRPRSN